MTGSDPTVSLYGASHRSNHMHATGSSSQHKRKRPDEPEAVHPSAKRSASDVTEQCLKNSGLRESFRNQIRSVFSNYSALVKTSFCYGSSNSTVSRDSGPELLAFQGILDSLQGSCATRRLAARLLPRFIHKFPHLVDQSASALMALYQGKHSTQYDVEEVLDATRMDALRGLADILEASQKLADKAVPTVLRVVDFLLRHLYAHTASSKDKVMSNGSIGGSSNSNRGSSLSAIFTLAEEHPEDMDELRRLMELAFRKFPRVVLSCCLQAFKSDDRPLFKAAHWFCGNQLLAERSAATCEASATAPSGQGSHAAKDAAQAPSKSHDKEKVPVDCLAKEILSQLPDTQQWLKQAIVSISKDKKILSAKEVHGHIDKLLKLIAPPPPPPPPASAPPPAPLGGPSQLKSEGGAADAAAHVTSPAHGHAPSGQPHRSGSSSAAGAGTATDGQAPRIAGAAAPDALQVPSSNPHPASALAPGATPQQQQPPQQGVALPTMANLAALPVLLTPLAVRGGPCTRADACLFFSALPPALNGASLRAECARYGSVESVHVGTAAGLAQGEAHVVFTSVRDAAICYESLVGGLPFGGSRPLHLEFCPGIPADTPVRARQPLRPASNFVWLAGHAAPEAVVRRLQEGGMQQPQQILRVAGRVPGLLLDMPSNTICQAVVDCLIPQFAQGAVAAPHIPAPLPTQAHAAAPVASTSQQQPAGATQQPSQQQPQVVAGAQQQQPLPAPGGSMPPHLQLPGSSSAHLQGQGSAAATPHGMAAPGMQSQQPQHLGSAASAGSQAAQANAALDLYAHCRTLWIGQLHETVSEGELLGAFKQYGDVVSYRLLRASHCAFIDFATHKAAADAKRMLHGVRFGPMAIRVEWKEMDRRTAAAVAAAAAAAAAGSSAGSRVPGMPMSLPSSAAPSPAPAPGPMGPMVNSNNSHILLGGIPPRHLSMMMGTRSNSPALNGPGSGAATPMGGASAAAPRRMDSWGAASAINTPAHVAGMAGHMGMEAAAGAGQQQGLRPAFSLQPYDSGPAPLPDHAQAAPLQDAAQQQHHYQQQRAGSIPGGGLHTQGSVPRTTSGTLPAAALSQHQMSWRGTLAKSGAPVCSLACPADPQLSAASGGPPGCNEPTRWPASLDVRMRVDLQYVVHQLYAATPSHQRAVRRLLPAAGSSSEDAARLQEFVSYLAEKGRAGVVKLDPADGYGGQARALYLVPPSAPVCNALGAAGAWVPNEAMVLAVVVPTAPAAPAR